MEEAVNLNFGVYSLYIKTNRNNYQIINEGIIII